jgi:hypothetical protein
MEPRASFLSLCAHSFVVWLLTNILGFALTYLSHSVFMPGATIDAAPTAPSLVAGLMTVTLAFFKIILPYAAGLMVAFYLALLWPLLFFLPQLWALSAAQPPERRGRLLLALLTPFSLFAAGQLTFMSHGLLVATACYCLACLLANTAVFWRWVR